MVGARPGQGHGGSGGARDPGRPLPVGPLAAAREGDPRVCCLRPHGLTAGGDPGRPRRGRRGRRGRARKTARQRAWAPAGEHSPAAGVWADRPPVIDIDATLVGVHSTSIRRNGGCGPDPFKKGLGDPPDRMIRPRHRQRRRRARGTRAAPRKRRDAARAPTTSRSSAGRWTRPGPAPDPAGGSWRAPMGPEARRRPSSRSPAAGRPTAQGFTPPDHTPQTHGHHPPDHLVTRVQRRRPPRERGARRRDPPTRRT